LANALTIAIQSLHNDQLKLDGISRNLANVSTVGYRRESFVARPFAQVMQGSLESGVELSLGVPQLQAQIDHRTGTLKETTQPLDVAIEGEGFFEVATANGPAYTRQGNFHLDARGRVVTDAGDAVMGVGGDILLTAGEPQIDRQGRITDANGRLAGQLKVVRFEGTPAFTRLGAGLLQAPAGTTPLPAGSTVRQGHVESSNVSSMTEMVGLVQTVRHYESSQRVVQAYDEMMDKAFRKLGDL